MPLTHAEYRDLREEIEENIAEKAIAKVRRNLFTWLGIGATLMGLGGWAFLTMAFERKGDEIARHNQQELDEQSLRLDAELREAQYQLFRIEEARQTIREFQAEMDEIRTDSEGLFDALDAEVDRVQISYAVEMAHLVYTRDRLAYDVALLKRHIDNLYTAGFPGAGGLDKTFLLEEPGRPARKIVILRESAGDTASKASLVAAVDLADLSSRLRVALATHGYEIEEWVTTRGASPEDDITEGLFTGDDGAPLFSVDRAVIFAHDQFDGPEESLSELVDYMEEQPGVGRVGALPSALFSPKSGYLKSRAVALGGEVDYEPHELAVLYLPLAMVREL